MTISAAAQEKSPILLVLTNNGQMGDTDTKTGFYLSEAAHPYAVFTEAGYAVVLASPKGGFAPLDPKSLELEDDEANQTFWEKYGSTEDGRKGVAETQSLADLKPQDFSGIFYVGGHGTMWDLPTSEQVQRITAAMYEQGGVVGAVCHGPAALVNVKLDDGSHLIDGKKVAVFTDSEEKAVELADTVPFLLETKFEKLGATVVPADDFTENAIRDGQLVTGQNPASAHKAAKLFVEALEEE